MIMANIKKRQSKNNSDIKALMLNSKMYFGLLALQLLNLLTLVLQFHWLYLLFAFFVITLQFALHVKLARKHLKTSSTSIADNQYSAPKILPSWLILILAITGSVGIAIGGKELGLLLSMVHLLCFAYSLKMFEIPKRKDVYQLVVLGIFVATSSLIFIQSIYFSLAVILLVFANFYVLLNLFAPKSAVSAQAKLLGKLGLYSIPFAVVLFVGFPKLSPFWEVPSVKSATVGLSDSVKIGDIANLALSNELAFRVSFEENSPKHSQLYWRAMVLDDFDGITWRQDQRGSGHGAQQGQRGQSNQRSQNTYGSARLENSINSAYVDVRGAGVSYQVIAEPSFQSWLFALDFATSEQSDVGRRSDFALFYRGIISQTMSYQVTSYPEAVLAPRLSRASRQLNLTLSTQNNPRLLAKAQQLRQRYQDDSAIVNHVLAEFNQNNYFYTLQPPGLNNNSLDQFYFDTRAGFCEHYASSFTYLMRAAGIPARMVVGYLGGEFNSSGNYLSVYQRNAHAWSEIWLPDRGWQRVDPTAAVDPERVERGFSSNLMQEHSNLSSGLFSMQALRAMQWYKQFKMQIEALDYQWTRWVIGYTGQKQHRIMAQILASLKSGKQAFYWLMSLVVLALFVGWFKQRKVKGSSQHKITQGYLNTLTLLAQHNVVKEKSMTAQQFAKYIEKNRPELSASFSAITACFEQFSYQAAAQINEQQLAEYLTTLKLHYRRLRWQLWLAKLGIH